jgi:hypothetical protein
MSKPINIPLMYGIIVIAASKHNPTTAIASIKTVNPIENKTPIIFRSNYLGNSPDDFSYMPVSGIIIQALDECIS